MSQNLFTCKGKETEWSADLGWGRSGREVYFPLTSHLDSGLSGPAGRREQSRAGLSRPTGEWGAGLGGTAPPARHRFKSLLRRNERGRSRSPSQRTEPIRQVHGCGDGSGMTGHHGWGYGQDDGRRRSPLALTRLDSSNPHARSGFPTLKDQPGPLSHPDPRTRPACQAPGWVPPRWAQSTRCVLASSATRERPGG